MKIGKSKLIKFEDGFYSNHHPCTDFREDTKPLITITKIVNKDIWKKTLWKGMVLDGPYCENTAFECGGNLAHCVKRLKEYAKLSLDLSKELV